ncbi:substrate-binding domain-containing protein [Aestuariivirga sp.]|jgi:phosphate transport system substrate-binding protein|uniref:substrate-binding domain-containing protein n=1 Tax=Aestuariivirga sp. TaxID=2650926 RepID=UPI003783C93C
MKRLLIATSLVALTVAPAFAARDQIRIVGSSTVYPFTTAVAEQFGKKTGMNTPVVESTGTGGGMKLFCEGVGENTPDASNASRRIKKGEFEDCQKNGVTEVVEVQIGFDGLTLAHSKSGTPMNTSFKNLFLALAKEVPGADGKLIANPYKNWNEIDPSLPAVKIEVLGPPPTSGTRDSFHELMMERGALEIESLAQLKKDDAKAFEKIWKSVREDGAYVEAGENDNVIVQKLEANPSAFGIFGFSFLEENAAKLVGVELGGVSPTFETIASGDYKASRPLYIYFKKQHVGVIPGLAEFAAEYVSDAATGEDGYLGEKGLVPLPEDKHEAIAAAVAAMTPMTGDGLK